MKRKTKIAVAAGAIAAVAAIPIAGLAGGDDDASDQPITGEALGRASQVALDHVGEGTVTETEVGDEESYYEVEVTRNDGSQVDVQLDKQFKVVGSEDEPAGADDTSTGNG